MRTTRRGWLIGLALGALTFVPRLVAAQATVSGQLTLLEKPGAATTDLESAVVYLIPADPAYRKLKTSKATITMHDRDFAPPVTVMTTGSTIRFENQDPFDHNAFSSTPGGTFDFGIADRGSSVAMKLKHAGVYPVFCNIHSRMAGFVLVVPTPYFGLAGSDGRFSLSEIPAGKYTLVVWHQRGGETRKKMTVPAAGVADLAISLDARGFHKTEHKNKYGEDYKSETGDRY